MDRDSYNSITESRRSELVLRYFDYPKLKDYDTLLHGYFAEESEVNGNFHIYKVQRKLVLVTWYCVNILSDITIAPKITLASSHFADCRINPVASHLQAVEKLLEKNFPFTLLSYDCAFNSNTPVYLEVNTVDPKLLTIPISVPDNSL